MTVPRKRCAGALVFTVCAAQALWAQESAQSDREAMYQRYRDLDSYIRGGMVEPHWLADGSSFWYAEGAPENTVIWKVDPHRNTREPHTIPVVPDSSQEEKERVTPRRGELPSPDGRWIASVRDYNLWLRSAEDGSELQLTSDGVEDYEWVLGDGRWRPDGLMLAAIKQDSRQVPRIPLVDWLGSIERVEWVASWPNPGKPIRRAELFLIDVRSAKRVRVDTGAESDQQGVVPVQWLPDGSHLLFFTTRPHRGNLALMAADATTGSTRLLLNEEHPVSMHGLTPDRRETPFTLLEDGTRFLWVSARTGWRHLYLYDLAGHLIRPVTRGEFWVQRVLRVDEETGWVYFTAHGDPERPNDRPYDLHLYRVNLQGEGLMRLTEAPGQHEIRFAPSGQFYLDTHSDTDRPRVVELRRNDGTLLRTLETADVTGLEELRWTAPEEFVVRSTDGKVDLHGVLYKPFDFEAGKKYPIILHTSGVGRAFAASARSAAMAQLGFVVFEVDLLSRRRGELAETWTIGRYEVGDYVAALHGLAAKRPYMDLSRVGVAGSFYGGYHAIRAMLQAPDVFHVGIAEAAITDVYGHPIFYELGSPEANREAFEAASNLTLAGNLNGKLLLIHGTHDTAVPFSHAMKMVDALTRAGEPYDLIVLPGWGLWWPDTELWERYRWDAYRRYFQEHLKP